MAFRRCLDRVRRGVRAEPPVAIRSAAVAVTCGVAIEVPSKPGGSPKRRVEPRRSSATMWSPGAGAGGSSGSPGHEPRRAAARRDDVEAAAGVRVVGEAAVVGGGAHGDDVGVARAGRRPARALVAGAPPRARLLLARSGARRSPRGCRRARRLGVELDVRLMTFAPCLTA